jgi:hypothetical protein
MSDGYMLDQDNPIQTNAERRGSMIEGLIGKAADFAMEVGKQTVDYIADNTIPQGRDEFVNALVHGDAYWPGTQVDMAPDQGGVHGPASTGQEISGGVHGSPEIMTGELPSSLQAYSMGDYSPTQPSHNSLYFSPEHTGAEQSYEDKIASLASRPQPQMEQELEY